MVKFFDGHGLYIYRIGGIFHGEKFSRISHFRKKLYTENKNLYGSHLIFDRFAKI